MVKFQISLIADWNVSQKLIFHRSHITYKCKMAYPKKVWRSKLWWWDRWSTIAKVLFIYLTVAFTLNGEIMVMSGNCQISITVEIVMSFFEISFLSSSNHLLKHILNSKCIIRSLKRNKHQSRGWLN